ncbi:MAG TPA: phosphatidylglycerol lysyltransferase domain-containing protein [Bacillota bacterium]|nr:phosphatidylglycerol lysyltransferase domain-containing protein [Bacillota bacterium]
MNVYKKLEVSDIETLYPFFNKYKKHICDFTVGGLLMWRDWYDTYFYIKDDILYIRAKLDGNTVFTFLGNDNVKAVGNIIKACEQNSIPFELCSVTQRVLDDITPVYCLDAQPQRDLFDYIYDANDITTLSGRKYNGQRNHINRFKKTYPDWSFDEITCENRTQALEFYTAYKAERLKAFEAASEESNKVIEALRHFCEYHLFGAVLRAKGKIVGISLGEIVGDMLFVHIEKGLTEYSGVYPMLVNCFAQKFVTPDVKYINREEDEGDEGLRTSKLSYHPLLLKEKYKVTLKKA